MRFAETDAFGIVFSPNFYLYFDLAMHELLRSAPGDMRRAMRETGLGFPIHQSGASFGAPLYADDEITVESRITEVRARSLRVDHVIRRGETEIARGFEVRVHARREAGTERLAKQPISEELRAWLAAD